MGKNKKEKPSRDKKDITIDSIIEETRFLSEQEKMAKEAAKMSKPPRMEEIFSNKSKEVRLKSQNPLEADPDDIDIEKIEGVEPPKEAEEETLVTLKPTYDENTTVSDEIIDDVDSLNVRSINLQDVDTIDISLDDEKSEEEKSEIPSADIKKNPPMPKEVEGGELSSFERLFGKPKPVSAAQTVVSRVPVYQHESKVDKVHVRAGKFSAVVENEYKKYLASPNPVISQTITKEAEMSPEAEEGKPSAKKIAGNVMSKVVGFFSSPEEDSENDFKEKTIQIEDYRSHQDAKSIMTEVNANIRKMFVNSIYTGAFGVVSLILSVVCRIVSEAISQSVVASVVLSLVSLGLLGASCWVNRVTLINGLTALKRFKGNSDTGAAICAAAAVVQGIVSLIFPTKFYSGAYHLYSTIAIVALLLNSLGKLFMVMRVKENFKFVSQKAPLYAGKIYTNEDIARKLLSGTTQDKPIVAYQHRTDFMGDFLRLSYSPDPSEDMASKLAPVTLLCSLFASVLYGIVAKDVVGAFSVLALMTAVSTPVCDLLAVNLPLYKLSKDTLQKNAMLSGYPSVRQFCDTKAVICEARDLYPMDSITLEGVKAFTNRGVEDTMLSAAAVLTEAKNPMACIFDKIVEEKGSALPKVESVLYEDKLGLVGWVKGERILVGNRALMEKYAITTPEEEFENKHKIEGRTVTYLARSGELVAMFVVSYASTLRIAQLLQQAEANGVSLLVQTTDCNVTGEKIADDFGIFFRSVKVLPTGLGNVCIEITSQKEDTSRAYLATRGSFFSLLRAISGCVRLKSNISLAVVIQLIGVILGILLAATLALCAGVGALKGVEVLIFILFWFAAAIIAPAIQKP